jgi:type I restriction enzyme S subunit
MSELKRGYKRTEVGVQLLTGQTRLPGFSGQWERKTLIDVAEFLDGKRRPVKDSERAKMRGEFPCYGASGIVDYVNAFLFDEELILLGEDGENIVSRSSPLAFRVAGKIWVNNHAHVLRPRAGTDIGYLTEYLESLDYEEYNTGTAQPKLNKMVCSGIPIVIPTTIEEQTAIASVLSDMDSELSALAERLHKTHRLKQGMMQELLTGRIRLS